MLKGPYNSDSIVVIDGIKEIIETLQVGNNVLIPN